MEGDKKSVNRKPTMSAPNSPISAIKGSTTNTIKVTVCMNRKTALL